MPTRPTLDHFVDTVLAGDFVGAIESFYVEGASMRENLDAPRVGRDVLVEGERRVMDSFKSIVAELAGPVIVDGDRVAIPWRFAFTGADGAMRTLQEIAWQRWEGERIAEETFFYDPRQLAG
jgi:hypothetical protein